MPKLFVTENREKVPSAALWLTNIITQCFLISTLFSQDAFSLMLKMTSSMVLIPYLLVAAYGFIISKRGETYEMRGEERIRDLVFAGLATLYTAFMVYAGGAKFLLLSAILYAPGTALYFWARRERGKRVFTAMEWIIFVVVIVGAVMGIYGLSSGNIVI
jgi:arginine:ornithine antiporter/lysine permease